MRLHLDEYETYELEHIRQYVSASTDNHDTMWHKFATRLIGAITTILNKREDKLRTSRKQAQPGDDGHMFI